MFWRYADKTSKPALSKAGHCCRLTVTIALLLLFFFFICKLVMVTEVPQKSKAVRSQYKWENMESVICLNLTFWNKASATRLNQPEHWKKHQQCAVSQVKTEIIEAIKIMKKWYWLFWWVFVCLLWVFKIKLDINKCTQCAQKLYTNIQR